MFRFIKPILHKIFRIKSYRSMASRADELKSGNTNQVYFVWIDLEMTGLDESIHKILEVACVVTNGMLEPLHSGIGLVIHQSNETFDECSEWAREHLAKNGLMEESLNSKISSEEGDKLISEYIKKVTHYNENKGTYYLAGNSVHIDKRFLEKYMVNVNSMLHYRILDVSSIKILCSQWYSEVPKLPKMKHHRAVSDIMESINELKYYKEKIFKSGPAIH